MTALKKVNPNFHEIPDAGRRKGLGKAELVMHLEQGSVRVLRHGKSFRDKISLRESTLRVKQVFVST